MEIEDLRLIIPTRHYDDRGFFAEVFNHLKYLEMGIDVDFVQDNHSVSTAAGTIRGLHFQAPPNAQAKLVRCGRGAIFDIAVDIRLGSPTYGKFNGFELTADNGHALYIPVGFAHGFVTLQPNSEVVYKCSEYYNPHVEGAILWSSCGIDLSAFDGKIISQKDASATPLKDFRSPFIYGVNS